MIRYNRSSFKVSTWDTQVGKSGDCFFYEWKPKQLGFPAERNESDRTYVMIISKIKEEEVKSPAGSGCPLSHHVTNLHLLRPLFYICVKKETRVGNECICVQPEWFPYSEPAPCCWRASLRLPESALPECMRSQKYLGIQSSFTPKAALSQGWKLGVQILQLSHPLLERLWSVPHGLRASLWGWAKVTLRGALPDITPFNSLHFQCYLQFYLLLHWPGAV